MNHARHLYARPSRAAKRSLADTIYTPPRYSLRHHARTGPHEALEVTLVSQIDLEMDVENCVFCLEVLGGNRKALETCGCVVCLECADGITMAQCPRPEHAHMKQKLRRLFDSSCMVCYEEKPVMIAPKCGHIYCELCYRRICRDWNKDCSICRERMAHARYIRPARCGRLTCRWKRVVRFEKR
ncbi:hypothetical protein GGS23DRAFT_591316 [Durotheca rogersii]|uniref:uncharacterized protein n=1 Tax=Durotheca rogersii TaxID=419775 RepID=UPI00221E3E30|nr:uncharacterized protein GGS23DRAFT_591316 [Durotheca rogersii]KAI5852058.1 hypothetical protein GGS23DRAFT_591316 [Durotheca rogersii]